MLEIFPKVTILVHSGWYNKALQFVWLQQQKLIFSQFLKLESLRSRFWWSLVSGEGSPPGLLMTCFLLCSLMTSPSFPGMEGDRQTGLFMGAVTLGVKASTCEFWRDTMPQQGHVQELVEVVAVQSLSCVWPLQPHGLQHARLLCPPLSPEICSRKETQGRARFNVWSASSRTWILTYHPFLSDRANLISLFLFSLKKKKKRYSWPFILSHEFHKSLWHILWW